MNRTFIADLTPSRARLIMMMNRYCGMKIDRAVIDKAEEDRIPDTTFARYGIEDTREQRAVQFIIDMNFRAGLPTPANYASRRAAIIHAAVEIAGAESLVIDVNFNTNQKGFSYDLDYGLLVPERKKVVIIDLDNVPTMSLEAAGKFFPRLLLHANMRIQLAFDFGTKYSSASQIATVLYPSVEASIVAPYKKSHRSMVLATGCFPEFLDGYDADD